MAEENILIFSCDKKHIPNGIFTPFHQHSRFSLMVHLQIKWSEPFKKRVWQQIIQQKISNQANVEQDFSLRRNPPDIWLQSWRFRRLRP